MEERNNPRSTGHRFIAAALAAWFAYVAIDFLLHAAIFATWWKTTEAYWLPPEELFRFIPLGYAVFAMYCVVLTWLYIRLFGDRRSLGVAFRFGAIAGLVFGSMFVLANYAVFRMPASSLLVWPVSFLVESTAACATASWVLDAERPWRRVGLVLGAAILVMIVGVVIQNLLLPANGVS